MCACVRAYVCAYVCVSVCAIQKCICTSRGVTLFNAHLPGILESVQPHTEHHHFADREDSGCHGRRAEGLHSPPGSASPDAVPP